MLKKLTRNAPAKLNLFLHVTGKRNDGYHLLQSLFVPLALTDTLEITQRKEAGIHLTVQGNFATQSGTPEDNIILKAAEKLATYAGITPSLNITLTKNIPVGAGLGGGSSDAAATLLALKELWNIHLSRQELAELALSLGADVPFFLLEAPAFVEGIGEKLTPLASPLPELFLLLAYPNIHVSTPAVFKTGLTEFTPEETPQLSFSDTAKLLRYLESRTNSLYAPALSLCPEITWVIEEIAAMPGCELARMSGSGSTCFGLFSNKKHLEEAHRRLTSRQPGWWVEITRLHNT